MRFDLQWEINSSKIREVSKSDEAFPLITNSRDLSALELFNAYRSKHPVVEKRHDLFKNILVQQFPPQLNDLQKTMTGLVGLGPGIYQNISVSGQI